MSDLGVSSLILLPDLHLEELGKERGRWQLAKITGTESFIILLCKAVLQHGCLSEGWV